ncbi:MAG: hypothetical protein IKE55_08005 [Kiritimatiellae bacterium]|nr:hypothetical protein [Kiritimatiellia bacterium]
MTASTRAGTWKPTSRFASDDTNSPSIMYFFTLTRSAMKPFTILPIA